MFRIGGRDVRVVKVDLYFFVGMEEFVSLVRGRLLCL